jgi:predicted flap endonuclease-1-like 5' DNA nuclease
MTYLIGKMIFCLLLASLFSMMIGWLLKQFFANKRYNEQLNDFAVERDKFNHLKAELIALRDENKQIKGNRAQYQDDFYRLAKERKTLQVANLYLSKTADENDKVDPCAMGCLKEQLVSLMDDRDKIREKISQLVAELSNEEQCQTELEQNTTAMQAKIGATEKPDDLKKIVGIGKANEQVLREQGVTCYAQIAAFSAEDEKKYGHSLGVFSARISQEKWVEQARRLHKEKYGENI